MSKKSYYFPHDNNARNDEKIIKLRMQLGAEGYGIYFMLLEKILESSDYSLVRDYNQLAFDVRVTSDKIKSVIEDFGLFSFTDDGKRLQSESFINRMKPLDNVREQRRQAGLKSAEKRKLAERDNLAQTEKTQRLLAENSTTVTTTVTQNFNRESKVNIINKNKKNTHTCEENELINQLANSEINKSTNSQIEKLNAWEEFNSNSVELSKWIAERWNKSKEYYKTGKVGKISILGRTKYHLIEIAKNYTTKQINIAIMGVFIQKNIFDIFKLTPDKMLEPEHFPTFYQAGLEQMQLFKQNKTS